MLSRPVWQADHCRRAPLLAGSVPRIRRARSTKKTRTGFARLVSIPVGRNGVIGLAMLPMIVLIGVIAISFRDGEYGASALIGAAVATGTGPIVYHLVRGRRLSRPLSDLKK